MFRFRPFAALGAAVALCLAAAAHDDDPKLWAREVPYRGPVWSSPLDRLGFPVQPLASGNAGGTSPGGRVCGTFDCQGGVRLLSWMPLSTFPGAIAANDCWGYVSPSGREYALIGLSSATAVVEVTTPGSPQFIGQVDGPSSTWRDIKTYGSWAYAVSEGGGGIQVIDLSQVDQGIVSYRGHISRSKTHNAAVDVDSGFLYRAGGGRDNLHIYDLNVDPSTPQLVASWNDQYVHDLQVRTFTSGPAAGKQVAFLSSGDDGTLHTLDVTDKSNIVDMDELAWPNSAFAHQSWLSDDGRYAYVNDEYDEPGLTTTTYVFDVFDPSNMVYLGSFTNGNTAVGHNGFVRGDRLYEANYRSGLRVFDTSQNAVSPPEVAWFDTYPANDGASFNGLWGCYPFLPSGIVLGSDTVRGLFVWWVGAPQVDIAFPLGRPPLINSDGDTLRVQLSPSVAVAASTAMLHFDAGSGWSSTPMEHVTGELWNAVFPPLPCGSNVSYYVSATSTTNITWTSPPDAPSSLWHTLPTCSLGPFTYCVAKENSCGGTPRLSFVGTPSASSSSGFFVRANGAKNGKPGLVLYTDQGPGSTPFLGGTLCLWPQGLRRTPIIYATGGTSGQCDASFALDLNLYASGQMGGNPKAYLTQVGTRINVQIWGRDKPMSSFLSDAGQYHVGP